MELGGAQLLESRIAELAEAAAADFLRPRVSFGR
jgi:hypothetical protein